MTDLESRGLPTSFLDAMARIKNIGITEDTGRLQGDYLRELIVAYAENTGTSRATTAIASFILPGSQ